MSQDLSHEINSFRAEKDSYLRTDAESPIPMEERSSFKGLNYFPPENGDRVRARLIRLEKPDTVTMTTSKGTIRPYLKYGIFQFQLLTKQLQLNCYKATDDPHSMSLFVPFTDETSGKETYGAGRYLDIEETGGDDYVLDFNLAYNPYCAYNENYVCPIPPRENKLPVRVEAGEKNYKVTGH